MAKTNAKKKSETPKTAKVPKAKKAPVKKAEAAAPVEQTPTMGECPKGGDHEWTEENAERFCSKCKEPAAAKPPKESTKAETAKAIAEPKAKKMSAIDAAAKVLAESSTPMSSKELIDAMATKGLWTSPGGKTPHATLFSALMREINGKGKDARFTKTERGKFAAAGSK